MPNLLSGAGADRPTPCGVGCALHGVAICAGLHCLSPLTAIGTSPSHATPLWVQPHTPSHSLRSSVLRGCSARWTPRRCSLPSTTSQTRTSSTWQHRCVGRHRLAEHTATRKERLCALLYDWRICGCYVIANTITKQSGSAQNSGGEEGSTQCLHQQGHPYHTLSLPEMSFPCVWHRQ